MTVIENSEPQYARETMGDAGALFPVHYPAAQHHCLRREDAHIPVIESGTYKGEPLYKFVVREDTGQVVGLHSGKYPEVDGYQMLADMADMMFPLSTTSCTLWGAGERVAVTQELSDSIDLGGGDKIQSHLVWISSLDGSWSTSVYDMQRRFFCQNQLVGKALLKVRHTKNHDEIFEMKATIVKQAAQQALAWQGKALALKQQPMIDSEFFELVTQLVPVEDDMSTRKQNSANEARGSMRRRWFDEKEQWGEGNGWLAWNAIQGAEQHTVNSGRKRDKAKSLQKALEGKTPLANKAMSLILAQ
jgi:hypothetical protein